MPDTTLASWQDLLPTHLRNGAYRAGPELAWPRAQALDVVGYLQDHGRRILGVDVWLPTKPGPTPVAYDWSVHSTTMLARGPAEFIDGFRWALAGLDGEQRPPYFNLTVD